VAEIQGPGGESLAGTYDVKGSQVRVRTLLDEDVHLSDEMGGRVFSQRLQSFIIILSSGTVAQNPIIDTPAFGQ